MPRTFDAIAPSDTFLPTLVAHNLSPL